MNKTKKLMEETILFAMDSIKDTIVENYDDEKIKPLTESIKTLAEAYDIVHRGKKGEYKC